MSDVIFSISGENSDFLRTLAESERAAKASVRRIDDLGGGAGGSGGGERGGPLGRRLKDATAPARELLGGLGSIVGVGTKVIGIFSGISAVAGSLGAVMLPVWRALTEEERRATDQLNKYSQTLAEIEKKHRDLARSIRDDQAVIGLTPNEAELERLRQGFESERRDARRQFESGEISEAHRDDLLLAIANHEREILAIKREQQDLAMRQAGAEEDRARAVAGISELFGAARAGEIEALTEAEREARRFAEQMERIEEVSKSGLIGSDDVRSLEERLERIHRRRLERIEEEEQKRREADERARERSISDAQAVEEELLRLQGRSREADEREERRRSRERIRDVQRDSGLTPEERQRTVDTLQRIEQLRLAQLARPDTETRAFAGGVLGQAALARQALGAGSSVPAEQLHQQRRQTEIAQAVREMLQSWLPRFADALERPEAARA